MNICISLILYLEIQKIRYRNVDIPNEILPALLLQESCGQVRSRDLRVQEMGRLLTKEKLRLRVKRI